MENAAPRHQLSVAQRLRRNELIAEALRLRESKLDPIRLTRAEAIEMATKDARDKGGDLVVEPDPDDPTDRRSVESRFS